LISSKVSFAVVIVKEWPEELSASTFSSIPSKPAAATPRNISAKGTPLGTDQALIPFFTINTPFMDRKYYLGYGIILHEISKSFYGSIFGRHKTKVT
jgi:hypothetical protein